MDDTTTPNSLTFLMFPFHFDTGTDKNPSLAASLDNDADSIWERSDDAIEDNVMYDYITPNIDTNTTPYLVYSIKSAPKSATAKRRINNIWKKIDAQFDSEEKTYGINFRKETRNWNSARLVISPLTNIGLLSLGVGIKGGGEVSEEDAVNFGYTLRKIDGQVKLRLTGYNPDKDSEGYIEAKQSTLEDILTEIGSKYMDTGECLLKDIVMFLLKDVSRHTESLGLFDTGRAHIFNYFSAFRPSGELTEDDKKTIIHFTRAENQKYQPLDNEFETSGSYMSTFKNIYMGCSAEGSSIFTIQSEDASNSFIKNFPMSTLQHRYMWLYIMALMQRHSLLRMITTLQQVDLDTFSSDVRSEFNNNYRYLCKIKTGGWFSNVSALAQHNQYYNFCMRNLQITSLYDEVSDKMETLNSYLEMRGHELQERKAEFQNRLAKVGFVISIAAALLAFPQTASALEELFRFGTATTSILTAVIMLVMAAITMVVWCHKKK